MGDESQLIRCWCVDESVGLSWACSFLTFYSTRESPGSNLTRVRPDSEWPCASNMFPKLSAIPTISPTLAQIQPLLHLQVLGARAQILKPPTPGFRSCVVSEKSLGLSELIFHPLQDEDGVGAGSWAWLLIRTTAGLLKMYQGLGLTTLKFPTHLVWGVT